MFWVNVILATICSYALYTADPLMNVLLNGACALYFAYKAHELGQKELYERGILNKTS